MSSSVPILNDYEITEIENYIYNQCKAPDFDPLSPKFRAALSLLSVTDKYRQKDALTLTEAERTLLMSISPEVIHSYPIIARVIAFRHLSRNFITPPQLQKAMLNLPNSQNLQIPNVSDQSFIHLTQHQPPSSSSFLHKVRNSFLTGAGQSPKFLIERKLAALQAASSDPTSTSFTPTLRDFFTIQTLQLNSAIDQLKLRRDFSRFFLDKQEALIIDNIPAIGQLSSTSIAPFHIGIRQNLAHQFTLSQKSTQLRAILNQSNNFFKALNQSFDTLHKIKNQIEQKKKKPSKTNTLKQRLNALKKHDIAAYRKYVDEMKDGRIQQLLKQTDQYMKELSEKIHLKHEIHQDGKLPVNMYDLEIKLPEDVNQPANLNGQLKDYQLKGLRWLVFLHRSKLNGILADEMGLGKTIQTIALLGYLYEKNNDRGPHLVCAPLSTIPNWAREFEIWYPSFNIAVYKGSPEDRKQVERRIFNRASNINVIITSYEFVHKEKAQLSKLDYSYIIIDEAHKIKNHQGKLSQALSHSYKSKNRLLLTGTPLQNNPKELWALLNFVLPTIFNDHHRFEEWFSEPFNHTEEKIQPNEEEMFLIITQLHAVLRPFLFRRLKTEVADELPEMIESKIIVAMSAWQKVMYETMTNYNASITPQFKVVKHENISMQQRKICNHPYLFLNDYYENWDFIRVAGKFEVLHRILPKLCRTGHRFLIFSQMTDVLDLLEQLMKMLNINYLRLDGNTKDEDRKRLMDEFNTKTEEISAFLLSTRAGGLGLNLQTADTAIIFDPDWNPFADKQAASRVHRLGQRNEVRVINLITADSVEERVDARASQKSHRQTVLIENGLFDDDHTQDDRKQAFHRTIGKSNVGTETPIYDDDMINRILARTPEELEIFAKLDEERNASLQAQWEANGRVGDYQPLMTEEELPDYLKVTVPDLSKDESLPVIRRSRSRNVSMGDEGF